MQSEFISLRAFLNVDQSRGTIFFFHFNLQTAILQCFKMDKITDLMVPMRVMRLLG